MLAIRLEKDLSLPRAAKPERLPTVLSQLEVAALLAERAHAAPAVRLIASLLYGSGLRLLECVRLRIKDVDVPRGEISVRDAKGGKARVAPLPRAIVPELTAHIGLVREQHRHDLADGAGYVELPRALALKYPAAPRDWPWQWLFPATRCPAGLAKRVSAHTLRHSFATHLLEAGYDMRPQLNSGTLGGRRP